MGMALGVAAAWAFTRFIQGRLFGVTAQDPATFLAVPLLFAAVALGACWVPAARAARIQPAVSPRSE